MRTIFILSCLLIFGCSNETRSTKQIEEDHIQNVTNRIYYFKDKMGICYSGIDSQSYGLNIVTSITTVPCYMLKIKP